MSRLRFSIVTPSYNHARFIGRTIDSILSQEGDFDLDYRVIDGASTDDTVEILRGYGDRLTWVSERDGGQVDAVNKGLRAATGDIVGWVNSDDVLLPGALAKVAAAFTAHPEAEWVHGRCKIIDADDREVRRWISLYKHLRSQRHTFENFLTEDYVSQMTTFWRREMLDEVGYLDGSLRFAFDHDLFLRFAQRGAPIYIPEPIACFRWYETSKSGAGYEVQMAETTALSAKYGASPWVLARAHVKKHAIVNIYRLMGLARARLAPRRAE